MNEPFRYLSAEAIREGQLIDCLIYGIHYSIVLDDSQRPWYLTLYPRNPDYPLAEGAMSWSETIDRTATRLFRWACVDEGIEYVTRET